MSINPRPNLLPANLTVANSTALTALSVVGFVYGDMVYNTALASYFTLVASTEPLNAKVVTVLNEPSARWIATDGAVWVNSAAITALTTSVATAQSIADSAVSVNSTQTTNIATAQSTANTAVANAATAQSTANGAVSVNTTQSADILLRPLTSDLASTAINKGASTIGINDAGSLITASQVESALQELATSIATLNLLLNESETGWKQKVASRFGATLFGWAYDDFTDDILGATWLTAGNAPTVSGVPNPGGVCKLTHNTSVILKSDNGILRAPRTKKWAVGGRVLMDGTIVSTERRYLSLADTASTTDPTNIIAVGMHQSVSATKFSFRLLTAGVTTTALSTINWDATTFHKMWIWFDGASVFGQIDTETPVLVTNSPSTKVPNVALFEKHFLQGAAGGTGDMFVDNVFVAVEL